MGKVICFFKPKEKNGYLSNWYPSPFTYQNRQFTSLEQYMMYMKAMTFNDKEMAEAIIGTEDPKKIKAYGRKVSGYNEKYWNGVRAIIVYNGLLEKFRQNEDLAQKLLETGDALLAECNPRDKIWGIALAKSDPDAQNIDIWKGQNLLGFALMEVRKKLKEESTIQ